jgi:hypothetical protein
MYLFAFFFFLVYIEYTITSFWRHLSYDGPMPTSKTNFFFFFFFFFFFYNNSLRLCGAIHLVTHTL